MRPSSASVTMVSRVLMKCLLMVGPQVEPGAVLGEEERAVEADLDAVAGRERGVGVGEGDELLLADGDVQVVLVAQVLDPVDAAVAAGGAGDLEVLGAGADGLRPGGRGGAGQKAGGDEVDRRLAEAGGDMEVRRALVDFARGADLDEPAGFEDADAVGHGHRLGLVVGNVEDGGAEVALDVLELEAHLGAELGVERGERLVHQVDLRLADQGAADGDALHLAAGEAGGAVVELVVDAHEPGDLGDAGVDGRLAEAAAGGLEREGEVLADGEVGVEGILLEDEGDVALGGGELFDAGAGEGDAAGVGALDAGDEAQRGGLAGAGGAEQDDEFAVGDGEREVADGAGAAEALGEAVEDHFSHGGRRGRWRWRGRRWRRRARAGRCRGRGRRSRLGRRAGWRGCGP